MTYPRGKLVKEDETLQIEMTIVHVSNKEKQLQLYFTFTFSVFKFRKHTYK